ncbi:MAG: SRPBCC family protein [Gemmataceae bacterium]
MSTACTGRLFPIHWRTEIAAWEPPFRFVDRQVKGPYRRWVHEHTFEEHDGGTLLRDRVDYAVPGWLLEPVVHGLVVGPDVRRIFDYRRAKMIELFGGSA